VAIGNALGEYQNTVTSGIVSGVGRPVTAGSQDSSSTEQLDDLIQTDAAINEGNSGGPLVNLEGQVIGINTAVASNAQSIGFAIPIDATKGVLSGVLANGKIARAYLGVAYTAITPAVQKQSGLSVSKGAYVYASSGSSVVSGSPADKAGVQDKDIIRKVNDATVGDAAGLSTLLGQYTPGTKVTLTILRAGKTLTLDVTLAAYSS
jgi:serine protease Do